MAHGKMNTDYLKHQLEKAKGFFNEVLLPIFLLLALATIITIGVMN